jgi:hypothetical protein
MLRKQNDNPEMSYDDPAPSPGKKSKIIPPNDLKMRGLYDAQELESKAKRDHDLKLLKQQRNKQVEDDLADSLNQDLGDVQDDERVPTNSQNKAVKFKDLHQEYQKSKPKYV